MRLVIAGILGAAVASAAAVVLGDYPLSGSVPWVAAFLIPLLIGVAMVLVDRRHAAGWWIATGPLAAASLAWGVRIATGWGLDPVPAAGWAAMAIGLVWPPLWGLRTRKGRPARPTGPASSRAQGQGAN